MLGTIVNFRDRLAENRAMTSKGGMVPNSSQKNTTRFFSFPPFRSAMVKSSLDRFWIISLCVPQAVLTRQLDTRAVRDIVQKVFPLIHGLHEALPCLTDELIGPLLRRLFLVVVILQQFRRLREGADEPPDVRLLFFRGRESAALICQQLHSFPCCNIVHPVTCTCFVHPFFCQATPPF